jgi:hypothetical protein
LPNSPPPKVIKRLRRKLFYATITMMRKLNDAAVAAAAGVPAATLAAWLRRGHLRRPAAGWRLEDAVYLRVIWLLTSAGLAVDAAAAICDSNRAAIWRASAWLVLVRRQDWNLTGGGAIMTGETLALDRPEDLRAVLARTADAGVDATEALVIDLHRLRQKSELALAHHLSTRRPRGRPRENKESET